MRRLIYLLAVFVLTGCASAKSDSAQDVTDRPPSSAASGTVAIWTISGTPLLREWPRVKTWTGHITRCTRSTAGPEVDAVTDDGLPVAIEVVQPAGQLPRLAATVKYAVDGRQPHGAANDRRLLVVSEEPFVPEQAGDGTDGNFAGPITHGPEGEAPRGDGQGTLGHIAWRCPGN
jgi:hypothetical protein